MSIGNPVSLTGNISSKSISVTATAGQTLFTVTGGYRINQISVFRNGTRLVDSLDYTARDGSSVTLLSAATLGDVIEFQIFDTFRAADALDVNSGGNVNGNVNITGNLTVTGTTTLSAGSSVSFATTAFNLSGTASTAIAAGTAYGLTGSPDITVGNIVGTALTLSGNLTVNGTQTIINTQVLDVADKNIGIGSTSSPSDTLADGAGITIYGTTNKTLTWSNTTKNWTFVGGGVTVSDLSVSGVSTVGLLSATNLSVSGIATIATLLDIKGAVETVSTGSTYDLGGGRVILECDARNGTVFTHDLANGVVGITSLKNFPVTKNSATTFTILFTQNATGTANTTAATGIGTNVRLTPFGVSGFTTTSKVATASTVTLSTTALDVDFVSFMVHYNGSGTGSVNNYKVYVSKDSGYRYGSVGF